MARNPNLRWRQAMLRALEIACDNGAGRLHTNEIHRIWGMRAIRDFERINGVPFDPSSSHHLMVIAGKGRAKVYLAYMRSMAGVARPRDIKGTL